MMQHIDYGDINKFLVSIGIILIGLAVIIPYLYLQEDFGLYLEKEQLLKFEEPVQKLIVSKQNLVMLIQKYLLFSSILMLLIGIASCMFGLIRWFKKQAIIDERFEIELDKLKIELKSMTPEEKEEKAKNEVDEIEFDKRIELKNNVHGKKKDIYNKYVEVEQRIYKIFKDLKSPNFEVYTEQILGNRFYIDLFLKAKTKKFADRIIEIKFFDNQLPFATLKRAIDKLNTYVSYYKANSLRKSVVPVLLIVYNKEKIGINVNIIRIRLMEYIADIPNLKRLKVEFIEKDTLDNFDARKILLR